MNKTKKTRLNQQPRLSINATAEQVVKELLKGGATPRPETMKPKNRNLGN